MALKIYQFSFLRPFIRRLKVKIDNRTLRVVCLPEKKIAYYIIPKSASSSLKWAFFESEEARKEFAYIKRNRKASPILGKRWTVFSLLLENKQFKLDDLEKETVKKYFLKMKLLYRGNEGGLLLKGRDKDANYTEEPINVDEMNDYFIFTFVRNPFERLVSCFQNKYIYSEEKREFVNRENFEPLSVKDFSDLVFKVNEISDEVINLHLESQWFGLEILKSLGIELNFIGKLENIEDEFEPIRKKYGLLPLEIRNFSKKKAFHKNWQDYYTFELARIIYQRFEQDFENLGYQNEYPKLLSYIRKNHPNKWNLHWRKRKLLADLGFKKYKKYFN